MTSDQFVMWTKGWLAAIEHNVVNEQNSRHLMTLEQWEEFKKALEQVELTKNTILYNTKYPWSKPNDTRQLLTEEDRVI